MPVGIVESEKTAIICSIFIPDMLWMATGSLQELKPSKMNILNNRLVVAYPDLGAYQKWKEKSYKLIPHVTISSYLERIATKEQRREGLDLADFLLEDYNTTPI